MLENYAAVRPSLSKIETILSDAMKAEKRITIKVLRSERELEPEEKNGIFWRVTEPDGDIRITIEIKDHFRIDESNLTETICESSQERLNREEEMCLRALAQEHETNTQESLAIV